MSSWSKFTIIASCVVGLTIATAWVSGRPDIGDFVERHIAPYLKVAFILGLLWAFLGNKDLHTLSGLAGFLYNP